MQGTSDLMPADITGVHAFDAEQRQFVFRPGPVFADVLLVDEINRAGPKTQSALLEAMEERQVTVDRQNYPLPEKFLVVATQNPREFEGTYPLPESQLDRFMLRIDLSYPAAKPSWRSLLATATPMRMRYRRAQQQSPPVDLQAVRQAVEQVHLAPELSAYVVDIAAASRSHTHVSLGLSTRGVLALVRAARISAGMRGGDFVTPDDVKQVAPLVIPHRLMLAPEALLEGVTEQAITQQLLDRTPVPR